MTLGCALLHPTYGDSIALAESLVIPDITIGHNGILEDGFLSQQFSPSATQVLIPFFSTVNSLSQDSTSQVGSRKISPTQNSSLQISLGQIGISEVGETEAGILQNASGEVGTFQIRLIQKDIVENGIAEVNINEKGVREIDLAQVGTAEVTPLQIGTTPFSTTQIDSLQSSSDQFSLNLRSPKISLTSNVTLQQFLGSHNFSLQNTTIPTWTEFLTGTTPFNLKIEIIDLPTGQLAEANITHFDSNGRPTSGTLTHLLHRRCANDTDANGLGWF
jgi:hypothetical protein